MLQIFTLNIYIMINSKQPSPYFITFEGCEGAGKSTQVKLLSEAFARAGLALKTTREPGGTKGAESIRNLLVNGDTEKWEAQTELLLHLAARNDHVNKFIKPHLNQGINIICDRFTDSTIAYQAYGHQLGKEFVEQVCNLFLGNFEPNLTIILDIDINTGINRASLRGESENRYEKMGANFHERVRNGFLEIARLYPQRCVVINADCDIDSIHKEIIAKTQERLGISL
jgi:dTMP kinase